MNTDLGRPGDTFAVAGDLVIQNIDLCVLVIIQKIDLCLLVTQ